MGVQFHRKINCDIQRNYIRENSAWYMTFERRQ